MMAMPPDRHETLGAGESSPHPDYCGRPEGVSFRIGLSVLSLQRLKKDPRITGGGISRWHLATHRRDDAQLREPGKQIHIHPVLGDLSIPKPKKLDLGPCGALARGWNSQEFGFMCPCFSAPIGNHIALGDDLVNGHLIFRKCRK